MSSPIRASEARAAETRGFNTGRTISHNDPRVPAGLWPALLGGEITIQPLKAMATSAGQEAALLKRGATIEELPIPLYRRGVYSGTVRLLDNSDWLKGKEPVYGDMANLDSIRKALIPILDKWKDRAMKDGSLVGSMEMQDLEKITAQQWKPPGWFLESPVTTANVPKVISHDAVTIMRRVCRRYAKALATDGFIKKSIQELTLMDSDPPDTMTGAPTWVGGPGVTHAARLAALSAFPSPVGQTPNQWAEGVRLLNKQLGYPDGVAYSPVVSTRQGPFKKFTHLWVQDDYGYRASYEAKGLYSRTRFVYPAPYAINFLLSPIYELCSTARQRIPGLWHDPERQDKYVAMLRKQGSHPYSIDFSGMDTAMWPNIIQLIIASLQNAGFPDFPLAAFSDLYRTMKVVYPSYYGDAEKVTALSGSVRPWCSGFKLTSEFDTIYGASVLLTALQDQIPDIVDRWEKGSFVFGELGDDIILTLPRQIDDKRFAEVALKEWGAKLEIIHDALFLKWMLPITPEVKVKCKPFSRFVQQTFFNEDRYSGTRGGDKPDAVLRIALVSRMTGLTDHPWFREWWPDILPVIKMLPFVKNADGAFQDALAAGRVPKLSDADVRAILAYGTAVPEYFSQIAEEAEFRASAAQLKATLEQYGLTVDNAQDGAAIRKMYWDAFVKKPSVKDIDSLRQYSPYR